MDLGAFGSLIYSIDNWSMNTINTLIDFIARSYSQRKLWTLFAVMLFCLLFFGILGILIGLGQPIEGTADSIKMLDLMIGYTQADVHRQFVAYGDKGIQLCLISTLVIDTFFPIAYAGFLALLLGHLLNRSSLRILILLPIVVMLVDFVENTHIALLLINFPELSEDIVYQASVCTASKWLLLGLTFMAISFGFFLKNRKHFFDHRPIDGAF